GIAGSKEEGSGLARRSRTVVDARPPLAGLHQFSADPFSFGIPLWRRPDAGSHVVVRRSFRQRHRGRGIATFHAQNDNAADSAGDHLRTDRTGAFATGRGSADPGRGGLGNARRKCFASYRAAARRIGERGNYRGPHSRVRLAAGRRRQPPTPGILPSRDAALHSTGRSQRHGAGRSQPVPEYVPAIAFTAAAKPAPGGRRSGEYLRREARTRPTNAISP